MANKKIFLSKDASTYDPAEAEFGFASAPSNEGTVTIISACNNIAVTYMAVYDGSSLASTDPHIVKFHNGSSESGDEAEAAAAAANFINAIASGPHGPSNYDSFIVTSEVIYKGVTQGNITAVKLVQKKAGTAGNTMIAYTGGFHFNLHDDHQPFDFVSGFDHLRHRGPRTNPNDCLPEEGQPEWPMSMSSQGDVLFSFKAGGVDPTTSGDFATKYYVDTHVNHLEGSLFATGQLLDGRLDATEAQTTSNLTMIGSLTSTIATNMATTDLALFLTGQRAVNSFEECMDSCDGIRVSLFNTGQRLQWQRDTDVTTRATEDLALLNMINNNSDDIDEVKISLFATGQGLAASINQNAANLGTITSWLTETGQKCSDQAEECMVSIGNTNTNLAKTGETIHSIFLNEAATRASEDATIMSLFGDVSSDLEDTKVSLFATGQLMATAVSLFATGQELHGYIVSEAATRAAQDATLQSNIVSEAAARAAHVATLQGNIDGTKVSLFATGQELHGYIVSEAATRAAQDATLNQNINNTEEGLFATGLGLYQEIVELQAASGHYTNQHVMTFGDQSISGQKSFVEGVAMGNPLDIDIGGANNTPAINITEGGDNRFVIGADYIDDGGDNRLYVSSRGTQWSPQIREDIISFTALGDVGIGIKKPVYKLQVNGPVHGIGFVSTSDEKYKKDVNPINNALDKITAIEGVTFKWDADSYPYDAPEGIQLGLIAQQVEETVPDVVTTDKNGDKSISYDRLIPLLVEAVKEQQQTIDNLKSEIEVLKNK